MAAMENDTRLGVLPSTGKALLGDPLDASRLLDLAVEAERLGFASVWANDSLVSPRIEALTLLAAIASVTRRIAVGTSLKGLDDVVKRNPGSNTARAGTLARVTPSLGRRQATRATPASAAPRTPPIWAMIEQEVKAAMSIA